MMKMIVLFPLDQPLKPIPDLRYPEVIHLGGCAGHMRSEAEDFPLTLGPHLHRGQGDNWRGPGQH